MTLTEARAFVSDKSDSYTIYRLPAWPDNVWSATLKSRRELPDNAVIDVLPAPLVSVQQGGLFS